jgi:uncharacterized protein (TIGR02001 family)
MRRRAAAAPIRERGAHMIGHAPSRRGFGDERRLRINRKERYCRWARTAGVALLLAAPAVPAFAGDMPDACDAKDPPANGKPFDITVGGQFATDYIYRGITLSAHQPAVSASIEVDRGPFYFKFEPSSVKLPTNPSAELGFSAGFCKEVVDKIKIDIGVAYLYYPGEMPVPPVTSTSYGEAHATLAYAAGGGLTLYGMYAYSPNYSNTGAWEHYVEGSFDFDLPKVLPKLFSKDIEWSLSGSVGRSWFGNQSADLGGFPLPAYTSWSVGISFEYDPFTLGLTYSNTNLTKENCFVFTGDPNAAPGGVINPLTNPMGLRSNWCGPAFVGTLSYEFSPGK